MSAKTLAQKLFLKAGKKFFIRHPPEGLEHFLGAIPAGVEYLASARQGADIVLFFARDHRALESELAELRDRLNPDGALWVAYCKGTSPHRTDIHRDSIRQYAAGLGLKAVAMMAIDEDWSALRLRKI